MSGPGVVIVGGGLAGQRCAETLRRRGYDDPITMVCGEPVRPYDRPPLSKGLLAGTLPSGSVWLRPKDWYADNEVELMLGLMGVRLDPVSHLLVVSGGTQASASRKSVGSVAEYCVRYSTAPVVVVPDPDRARRRASGPALVDVAAS